MSKEDSSGESSGGGAKENEFESDERVGNRRREVLVNGEKVGFGSGKVGFGGVYIARFILEHRIRTK